jgi:dephospho-CoA kinase
MKVIGLTGSIAMGKSEVAKIFRDNGIPVFDSDAEVHRFYESADAATMLKPIVPKAVADHRVDRKKLSAAIVDEPEVLSKIEPLVHAEIARRRDAFLANAKGQGHSFAVVDIPLLFEKNTDRNVDIAIVVSSPEPLQRERALARPGMTEAKLDMILKRQMPDSEKRRRADIIIENDGTLDDLRRRTETVMTKLKQDTTS